MLLLRAAQHLCHEGVVSVFNIANLLIAASNAVSPSGYKRVGFSAQVKKNSLLLTSLWGLAISTWIHSKYLYIMRSYKPVIRWSRSIVPDLFFSSDEELSELTVWPRFMDIGETLFDLKYSLHASWKKNRETNKIITIFKSLIRHHKADHPTH